MAFAEQMCFFAKTPSELENMFRLWVTLMVDSGLPTETDIWTSAHKFPDQEVLIRRESGSSEPTVRRASKLWKPKLP